MFPGDNHTVTPDYRFTKWDTFQDTQLLIPDEISFDLLLPMNWFVCWSMKNTRFSIIFQMDIRFDCAPVSANALTLINLFVLYLVILINARGCSKVLALRNVFLSNIMLFNIIRLIACNDIKWVSCCRKPELSCWIRTALTFFDWLRQQDKQYLKGFTFLIPFYLI